jgi:hypothetical protein
MNIGLIGGIVGSAIGLAGGLFGTYRSYKAAKGPRERHFVIWASIGILVSVFLFLAILFLLSQWKVWIWTCYLILLPFVLRYLNRRQGKIQREEQTLDDG